MKIDVAVKDWEQVLFEELLHLLKDLLPAYGGDELFCICFCCVVEFVLGFYSIR